MVVGTAEVTVFIKVFMAMVVDSTGVGDRRATTLPLMIPGTYQNGNQTCVWNGYNWRCYDQSTTF